MVNTEDFLKNDGDILFRGYWCGGGEDNPKVRKGKSAPKSIDVALKNFPFVLGVMRGDVVLVDYDDPAAFQCRLKIAETLKEHCVVIESQNRGGHFYWFDRGHAVRRSNNKNKTLLTLYPVDYKCGYRVIKNSGEIKGADNYACLSKDDKSLRNVVYCNIREDRTLDEIPFYDLRLQSDDKFHFLGMGNGDGRQDGFFNYMIPVKKAGFSYEQFKVTAELIEQFLFAEPLGDEFENAVRPDAWESVNVAESQFFPDGKFQHDKFADYLMGKYHIRKINSYIHSYRDGVYIPGYESIEKLILDEIPSLTKVKINEVLNNLRIRAEESPSMDLNRIAFKNGILNLDSDQLEPFTPDVVVTNRIPWDYNPDAHSELVDSLLDRLSCGDQEIRYSLEEIAGACLYRSAALGGGMAVILVGDKSNGKSTYLHMLESMLGKDNYSALDIRELGDRFSTIMMFGKLANIGDDISSEYISDMSILKKLVTGEVVKAENKGEKPINYVSYATQIFSANDIPRMKDKSGAVSRRLLIIPFNGKFTQDSPEYDPFIRYKLESRDCMEHFIHLAVCGLHDVLDNGSFTVPAKAEKQKEDYDRENNPVLAFIEDVGTDNIINEPTGDVYRQYQVFCADNGFQPGSKLTFSKDVNRVLGTESVQKWINGKNVRIFSLS